MAAKSSCLCWANCETTTAQSLPKWCFAGTFHGKLGFYGDVQHLVPCTDTCICTWIHTHTQTHMCRYVCLWVLSRRQRLLELVVAADAAVAGSRSAPILYNLGFWVWGIPPKKPILGCSGFGLGGFQETDFREGFCSLKEPACIRFPNPKLHESLQPEPYKRCVVRLHSLNSKP